MRAKLVDRREKGREVYLTFVTTLADEHAIPEGDLELTAKKWRSPRSRDALNYSWHLITEIANAIQWDKDRVYKSLVNDYGCLEKEEDGSIKKLLIKADTNPMDLEIYLHKTPHSTVIEGTKYSLYWVVKPPHEYNTQEFAQFLDHIIEEAKELGIEVKEGV